MVLSASSDRRVVHSDVVASHRSQNSDRALRDITHIVENAELQTRSVFGDHHLAATSKTCWFSSQISMNSIRAHTRGLTGRASTIPKDPIAANASRLVRCALLQAETKGANFKTNESFKKYIEALRAQLPQLSSHPALKRAMKQQMASLLSEAFLRTHARREGVTASDIEFAESLIGEFTSTRVDLKAEILKDRPSLVQAQKSIHTAALEASKIKLGCKEYSRRAPLTKEAKAKIENLWDQKQQLQKAYHSQYQAAEKAFEILPKQVKNQQDRAAYQAFNRAMSLVESTKEQLAMVDEKLQQAEEEYFELTDHYDFALRASDPRALAEAQAHYDDLTAIFDMGTIEDPTLPPHKEKRALPNGGSIVITRVTKEIGRIRGTDEIQKDLNLAITKKARPLIAAHLQELSYYVIREAPQVTMLEKVLNSKGIRAPQFGEDLERVIDELIDKSN